MAWSDSNDEDPARVWLSDTGEQVPGLGPNDPVIDNWLFRGALDSGEIYAW